MERNTLVYGSVLVAAAVSAGCSDNRISLQEFMQIQQEQAEQVSASMTPDLPTAPPKAIDEAMGPYKVGPGDVLRIMLTGLEQEVQPPPLEARVDRTGVLHLPGAGEVKVAGLELEDVELAIHDAYVPELYRQGAVSVALAEVQRTDVLVVGAVTMPGLVPLRRTQRNLLYAIVAAGGVSDLASGDVELKRIRDPQNKVTLNVMDPEGLKAALALPPLDSGDVIYVVPAHPNTVFVGGLVNAPRPQTAPRGVQLTVLQALAASGGLRTDVTPREATLIRRVAPSKDIHVKLDLDRITTGRDPNITLAAGDILWVPDTLETRVQDFLNKNFFIRGGVSATVTYNANGIEYINRQDQQSGRFGGGNGSNLEDSFDPFGFIRRGQAIQAIPTTP